MVDPVTQLELYATVTEGNQRTTTQASMTDKPRSSSAPLEAVATGSSRSEVEVQDEISGCAFDGSYELIYNGRSQLLLSLRSQLRSASAVCPNSPGLSCQCQNRSSSVVQPSDYESQARAPRTRTECQISVLEIHPPLPALRCHPMHYYPCP